MDLGGLTASIGLDSSGFTEGLNQAKEALSGFSEIAGGVFAGMGMANVFEGITSGFGEMISGAVETANEFQTWGTVINATADGAANAFGSIGSAAGNAGAKAKASALEAQDALIKYNEKIKSIQDNIAEVMSGQNITDAVAKYTTKLADLQQTYADKVTSINAQIAQAQDDLLQTEKDNAQKMEDSLADMQASHDDSIANKKESQAKQLAQTTSVVAKAALMKKFAEENQLEQDSYNRAYTTKQAQLQRNLDEENAKAKTAATKKIENYQDELAKEATLEADKEAKLKAGLDAEVAKDKAANDKKLAQYQQELADEERSWALSQAKRSASGGGGGGGGGGAAGQLRLDKPEIDEGDPLAMTKNSAKDLAKYLAEISDTTPFKITDLEQVSQQMMLQNVDAAKMLPTIEQISGHFQKAPSETWSAMLMAINGRTQQLRREFHISSDDMTKSLGHVPKTANDVLTAVQNISKVRYADGIKTESDTAGRKTAQLENQFIKLRLSIMGINEETLKPVPGGIFDRLQQGAQVSIDFMKKHREEIANLVKAVVGGLMDAFGKFVGFIMSHQAEIGSFFGGIGDIVTALKPVVLTVFDAIVAGLKPIFAVFTSKKGEISDAFSGIGTAIKGIAAFIVANRGAIIGFMSLIGTAIAFAIKVIFTIVDFIIQNFGIIKYVLLGFALILAWLFLPAIGAIAAFVASWVAGVAVATATWAAFVWIFAQASIALGIIILGIVKAIGFLRDNWNTILKAITGFVNNAVNFIKQHFDIILSFLGPGGQLVLSLLSVHDRWKDITNAIGAFMKAFGDAFTNIAHAVIGGAITFIKTEINGWVTIADTIMNAWKKVFDFFTEGFSKLKQGVADAGKAIMNSHLNPFAKGSPSLIETVTSGLGIIQSQYASLGNMRLPSINSLTGGIGNMSGYGGGNMNQNYNTTNNLRTNNVTLNNNFAIQGQASAQNMAAYLAFQSSHFGAV